MRPPLTWPKHLPKAPHPNTIIWGLGIQYTNIGRTQTFSPLQSLFINPSHPIDVLAEIGLKMEITFRNSNIFTVVKISTEMLEDKVEITSECGIKN